MRIAINGFGRIGRIFFRQVYLPTRQAVEKKDFEIVAINDLGDKENLIYLAEHDSIHGKFKFPQSDIKFLSVKDPTQLPWGDLKIDVVVESTGVFASYQKAKAHLEAGAKRVVITAPVPKEDNEAITFTPNVGMERISSFGNISSNASCTTNAVTPVAAILSKNPGIKKAILNTVHAYTATQGLVDGPNKKDFSRGRAAAANIVPSHTGAAIATEKALPAIAGKFDGVAMRVPVICGSIIDFTFLSERKTSVEEINQILTEAAESPEWKGIIKVSKVPLVSSDIVGEPYGSIVDLSFTRVVDGDLVKVFSWYDNEWGYCAMLIRHIEEVGKYL